MEQLHPPLKPEVLCSDSVAAKNRVPATKQIRPTAQLVCMAPDELLIDKNACCSPSPHNLSIKELLSRIDILENTVQNQNALFQQIKTQEAMQFLPCHKTPKWTIPTFSGDTNEDFEQFESDLEEYHLACKWPMEMKASQLVMMLSNKAKHFYQGFSVDDKSSFQNAMLKLKKRFGFDAKPATELYELLVRKQRPSETVSEYALQVSKNIRKAKIADDRLQVAIFIQGLIPNLGAKLIIEKPSTLEEAEKYACQYETAAQINSNKDTAPNALSVTCDVDKPDFRKSESARISDQTNGYDFIAKQNSHCQDGSNRQHVTNEHSTQMHVNSYNNRKHHSRTLPYSANQCRHQVYHAQNQEYQTALNHPQAQPVLSNFSMPQANFQYYWPSPMPNQLSSQHFPPTGLLPQQMQEKNSSHCNPTQSEYPQKEPTHLLAPSANVLNKALSEKIMTQPNSQKGITSQKNTERSHLNCQCTVL